jgi:hypothetical protein
MAVMTTPYGHPDTPTGLRTPQTAGEPKCSLFVVRIGEAIENLRQWTQLFLTPPPKHSKKWEKKEKDQTKEFFATPSRGRTLASRTGLVFA